MSENKKSEIFLVRNNSPIIEDFLKTEYFLTVKKIPQSQSKRNKSTYSTNKRKRKSINCCKMSRNNQIINKSNITLSSGISTSFINTRSNIEFRDNYYMNDAPKGYVKSNHRISLIDSVQENNILREKLKNREKEISELKSELKMIKEKYNDLTIENKQIRATSKFSEFYNANFANKDKSNTKVTMINKEIQVNITDNIEVNRIVKENAKIIIKKNEHMENKIFLTGIIIIK